MDSKLAELAARVEAEGFGVKVSLTLDAGVVDGTLVPFARFMEAQQTEAAKMQNRGLAEVFAGMRQRAAQEGMLYLIDAGVRGAQSHDAVARNVAIFAEAVREWTPHGRVPL